VFLANNTQKLAVRILESHIREGRVSSSYIFSGAGASADMAEMAGERHCADIKEEFATAFAIALLSGSGKLFDPAETPLSQRVWSHSHPDVQWVKEDEEKTTIGIGSVRAISLWASMKPFESAWKVCVVLVAEKLTEDAANAFLKTLEEPPKNTVFLLLVENKNNLLETIQSRSFEIRLMPMAFQAVPLGAGSLEALPVREIFETYPGPGLTREEVKQKLDGLMQVCREKIRCLVTGSGAEAWTVNLWIEAMDLLYDSKAALDMNANQKLMATRLAIRLARLFPSQKAVSL